MAELIYYVASSIDGFIADTEGGVDWLDSINSSGIDHGYNDFYSGIDSLIIGRGTYDQILEFGDWPYPDKPSWVMTAKHYESTNKDIILSEKSPQEVMKEITGKGFKRTWLVGGGKLAQSFHNAGLITEYFISIIPIILGGGIHLLAVPAHQTSLVLKETNRFDTGVVQVRYVKT